MRAVEVLSRQMEIVNGLLHGLIDGISDDEWTWRPAEGQNLIGFTLFHIPATQDWAIHTWSKNREDVRHGAEWKETVGAGWAAPFGMSLADADAMAERLTPADVVRYADAVWNEARAWLGTLSDDDLERVPETYQHQSRRPEYRSPGYAEEIEGMRQQAYWRLLSGACIRHCRGHLGEVDTALQIKRRS